MTEFADLELGLHQREAGLFTVEMRYSQPNSDADIRVGQGHPIAVQFNFQELLMKIVDPAAYGAMLTQSLFADKDLLAAFSKARASAQTGQSPLRIRLIIGPSAPELNGLFWETLRDPENDKATLFTGEQVYFSRYLSSLDWRPVKLRSKGSLKVLVAVANPGGLDQYSLAPVDVPAELARAQAALKDIPVMALPSKPEERCTLQGIIDHLRAGCDILYLAAHGSFVKEEPWLWLEDEQGGVARVSGYDLVTRIRELDVQPRLVVLASCQSAGKGAGAALQALGPKLAEGGVPAVVAMQGNISMDSVARFMPVFFSELQQDGQVDRAMSVARGVVRDASDFWMPVLFMRLRSGRVWYTPGFGGEADFKKWPSLLTSLQVGKCTPIIGAGLYEALLGSWRDLALSLAEKYRYPLAHFYRDALPQVTQFLSVDQSASTLLLELENVIRERVQNRLAADLPDTLKGAQASLIDLISFGGQKLRSVDELEQHRVLAGLKLPIYVTTNYDNMMTDALKEAGVDPQMVICPWSERFSASSIYDKEPEYRPSAERPLVYHLFGHFSVPDSLVLTEDDYFEFLIGVTSNKDLIPTVVRRALTDTALMFLGFQLDDWAFRIFFRSIMDLQGGGRRSKYAHIAVQVDPDEIRNYDPRRAREYLEDYFEDDSISIYWGQSADFIRELVAQRTANGKES
ncbi:MAG: CHAT domain-containing protein [Chloroflexi bacterium]|nr:CHAT domain-containing protein [Chloroflexota bacterium]